MTNFQSAFGRADRALRASGTSRLPAGLPELGSLGDTFHRATEPAIWSEGTMVPLVSISMLWPVPAEQRLSTRDHNVGRCQCLDPGCYLLRLHVHHLLVVVVACPVPGVGGVAPAAGQIAGREPDERRCRAGRAALALNRQEYLRLTRGEFAHPQHGGPTSSRQFSCGPRDRQRLPRQSPGRAARTSRTRRRERRRPGSTTTSSRGERREQGPCGRSPPWSCR